MELNLVFLSCSNCVGKVVGVTRYSNMSFFDNFELILVVIGPKRDLIIALLEVYIGEKRFFFKQKMQNSCISSVEIT